MKNRINKKRDYVFIIMYLILLFAFISVIFDTLYMLKVSDKTYKKIEGEIVDVDLEWPSDRNNNRNCSAKYRYVIDGVTYRNWDRFHNYGSSCPIVGTELTLYYDKEDPSNVTNSIKLAPSIITNIAILLTMLFMLVGAGYAMIVSKRKKKIRSE
jgi:flagellar basal body-associated protein FliL